MRASALSIDSDGHGRTEMGPMLDGAARPRQRVATPLRRWRRAHVLQGGIAKAVQSQLRDTDPAISVRQAAGVQLRARQCSSAALVHQAAGLGVRLAGVSMPLTRWAGMQSAALPATASSTSADFAVRRQGRTCLQVFRRLTLATTTGPVSGTEMTSHEALRLLRQYWLSRVPCGCRHGMIAAMLELIFKNKRS